MAAARAVGAVATPQHDAAIHRLQQLVMDPNSMLAGAAEDALWEIAQRHNRPDLAVASRYLTWVPYSATDGLKPTPDYSGVGFMLDQKSTRMKSSHVVYSYAVIILNTHFNN